MVIVLVLAEKNDLPSREQFTISTSFYPIYFIVSEIAQGSANVISITPSTSEPHDYEPTPRIMEQTLSSDLFIFVHPSFEPWARNITTSRNNEGRPSLQLITKNDTTMERVDPHIWLSPVRILGVVDQVTTNLSRLDPEQKTTYEQNATLLKNELATIDAAYRSTLSQCTSNILITDHDAFSYIARDYGLISYSLRGSSPESEPTIQTLMQITNLMRKHKVPYIFIEESASKKLASTIARETGSKIGYLSSLEKLTDEDRKSGTSYLTKLRYNLSILKTALQCP